MTRKKLGSGSILLPMLLTTLALACGCSEKIGGESVQSSSSDLGGAASADTVLGFEDPGDWRTDGGTLSSTPIRTQGNAALALDARDDDVELTSVPVTDFTAALAGLSDPASSFAIDVSLPTDGDHDCDDRPAAGRIELLVSSQALRLHHRHVATGSFRGLRRGTYSTMLLDVPPELRAALVGLQSGDLVFHVEVHAHGDARGTYRFDNLRVHAPSTPPPNAGLPLDLTALLSYAPPSSTPASATFPVGALQIPQSVHAKLGSPGQGSATLVIGIGGTTLATCTYVGQGSDYVASSCTGGFQAGDIVGADAVTLTIVAGDSAAGPTKVRAQLALDPLGDEVGRGLLPPMPTYWGATASESSQILDAFSTAVTATPPAEHVWVKTPVPDYARRTSDFSPVDTTNGPPAPNDPPFHKSGHANPGGSFDAYWALDGSLTNASTNGRNEVHFDADASTHAVLFGHDATIAEAKFTADTDTGQVTPNGIESPSASGSLHFYLFGNEIPGGGDVSPNVAFTFDPSTGQKQYNLPPIGFWVFSITVGLTADAGVLAQGTVGFGGIGVSITPDADFGAHLEGSIGVPGIISGGLDVQVELLTVSLPIAANASWTLVASSPQDCSATLDFSAGSNVTVSSGGGEVDLVATFGPCPLCFSITQKLFGWNPLSSNTHNVFTVNDTVQTFPLPAGTCTEPLDVVVGAPNGGGPIQTDSSTLLAGSASRRSPTGGPPTPVDCADLTWTSDNPADSGLFPLQGCSPTVDFGTPGQRTLTLTATDQYGETGQASIAIDVGSSSGPLSAEILSPQDGYTYATSGAPVDLHVVGGFVNGQGNVQFVWQVVFPDGTTHVFGGSVGDLAIQELGVYTVTLTVTATNGSATTTIHVNLASLE